MQKRFPVVVKLMQTLQKKWIDLETFGNGECQARLNTVKSKHCVSVIRMLKGEKLHYMEKAARDGVVYCRFDQSIESRGH